MNANDEWNGEQRYGVGGEVIQDDSAEDAPMGALREKYAKRANGRLRMPASNCKFGSSPWLVQHESGYRRQNQSACADRHEGESPAVVLRQVTAEYQRQRIPQSARQHEDPYAAGPLLGGE